MSAADHSTLPPPITSAFVPPYALQGQEFSCHVTWDKSRPVSSLSLDLSTGLDVVHLYNVKECNIARYGTRQVVEVQAFQEQGYFGFVLKSRVYRAPEESGRVRILGFSVPGGTPSHFSHELSVELFRPELAVKNGRVGPRAIHFAPPEVGLIPAADDPVVLRNEGKGTCVVLVSARGDVPLKMGDYLQQGETKARFRKSLDQGLDKLRKDYPTHGGLIERLEQLLSRDIMTEEEALAGIRELNEETAQAEKEDPEFADDMAQVFGDATMSVLSVDQRFVSWATAIGSNMDRRMILMNPWFALEVGPTPIVATFHLRGFDLQWHEHNQFSIGPLTLTAEETGLIPVCGVFQADSEPASSSERKPGRARAAHGRG